MLRALCPLCTGVSYMNSLIAETQLKTKLCIDMSHTTEAMAILRFLPIWPKFGSHGNVQHPLNPCDQKYLLWIG